jgi:hypothetical protein
MMTRDEASVVGVFPHGRDLRHSPRPPAQSQRLTRRQARRPAHDHLGHVRPRSSQRLPPRTSPPEPLHLRGVGRAAQAHAPRISQPVAPRHQTGRNTERHRPPQIGETRLASLRRRSARAGSHRTPRDRSRSAVRSATKRSEIENSSVIASTPTPAFVSVGDCRPEVPGTPTCRCGPRNAHRGVGQPH